MNLMGKSRASFGTGCSFPQPTAGSAFVDRRSKPSKPLVNVLICLFCIKSFFSVSGALQRSDVAAQKSDCRRGETSAFVFRNAEIPGQAYSHSAVNADCLHDQSHQLQTQEPENQLSSFPCLRSAMTSRLK